MLCGYLASSCDATLSPLFKDCLGRSCGRPAISGAFCGGISSVAGLTGTGAVQVVAGMHRNPWLLGISGVHTLHLYVAAI